MMADPFTKSNPRPAWRGKAELLTSEHPVWDSWHPLFKLLGPKTEGRGGRPIYAGIDFGEVKVSVPNLGDETLETVIAAFCAIERWEAAAALSPTVALEAVANLYGRLDPGFEEAATSTGTSELWRIFIKELGIPVAAQATNDFQPFIKWLYGTKSDNSGLVSRMASALVAWARYPADQRPLAYLEAGVEGSTGFAVWMEENGGYDGVSRGRGHYVLPTIKPEPISVKENPRPAPQPAQLAAVDAKRAGNGEPQERKRFRSGSESEPHPNMAHIRNDGRWHGRGSDWGTPQELYEELNSEFRFTLDVCATEANAKHTSYFNEQQDGLVQDWGRNIYWMNAPWGVGLNTWIKKAFESAQRGATVVCLVPAATDLAWWHDYALWGEIRYIQGRPKFVMPEGTWQQTFSPSAIVIFRPPAERNQSQDRPVLDPRHAKLRIGKHAIKLGDLSETARGQVVAALTDQIKPPEAEPESYWLTPPDIYAALDAEFHFDFDACPHPRPRGL
jgi:phage N-6-adenine-methyltransferase